MTQSPGHQKWPDHKVVEKPVPQELQVQINGEVIADSTSGIKVEEDDHPDRFYLPRSDVQMDKFTESDTTTTCPFKGQARYYNVSIDGNVLEDAAWSYEDPYDEHRALKDYVAFHVEKPEVDIRAGEGT